MGSPIKTTVPKIHGLSPLKQDEIEGAVESNTSGTEVAGFIDKWVTPHNKLELALSAFGGAGKSASWLTGKFLKTKAGQKLISKFPSLSKLTKPISQSTKKAEFDFTTTRDFGGGKVPKSLTAPQQQKLLTDEAHKYTHISMPKSRNLDAKIEDKIETMFRPINRKNTTIVKDPNSKGGIETYDDLIWFSSGKEGAKYGSGRYSGNLGITPGLSGKQKVLTGWRGQLNAADKKAFDALEAQRRQAVKHLIDKDGYLKDNKFRLEHDRISKSFYDKKQALLPSKTKEYSQFDVKLDPNARIKKIVDPRSGGGAHASLKVWSVDDIDEVVEEGYDAIQLVDDMGYDIETIVINKNIITPTHINKAPVTID